MADPYKDLPRGTPLNRISAGHIAGWNEAARAVRGERINSEFDAGLNAQNSTVVKVKNDSGAAVSRFSVMRVSGTVITYDDNDDQFWNNPALTVDEPGDAADQDVIAVLLDPLKNQAIGRATIIGLTPVKIYVDTDEEDWTWADVTSGETGHLVMNETSGCARVIWKQARAGAEKWALVELTGPTKDAGGELFITGFMASGTDTGAIRTVDGLEPSTSVAGNARGIGSVDLQMYRTSATMVASAYFATIIGGYSNTISETNLAYNQLSAIVGGTNNSISNSSISFAAEAGFIGGGRNNIIVDNRYCAIIGGIDAKADKRGQTTLGCAKFAAVGDSQTSVLVANCQTGSSSQTEMFLDGSGNTYKLLIADDTTWAFRILIVARRADANNESAAYELKGCIDRNAGTVALVGTVTKTVIAEDTAAWDVDAQADDSGKSLRILVTGESAKTIYWSARIELTEVTG